MEKTAIKLPNFLLPKADPDHYCECQERPVDLTHKTCYPFWLKKPGDAVSSEDVIAEVEADKKTVELFAPAEGVLTEICVADGEEFTFDTVLGYIEPQEVGA